MWGLSLVLAALTWPLLWWNRSQTPFSGRLSEVALPVLFATPGAVIVVRRPANPIGWLLCAIGLTQGVTGSANEYGHYALVTNPGSLPGGVPALMTTVVWVLFGCIPLLVLLFPTGSCRRGGGARRSGRWRPRSQCCWAASCWRLGRSGTNAATPTTRSASPVPSACWSWCFSADCWCCWQPRWPVWLP
jgi:hypothetical protein